MNSKIEVLLGEISNDYDISFSTKDIVNIDKEVNLSDDFLNTLRLDDFKVSKYSQGTIDNLYNTVIYYKGDELIISKEEFVESVCHILSDLYKVSYNVLKRDLTKIKDEIDIVITMMYDLAYDPYGPGFNKSAKNKVINPGGQRNIEEVLDSIKDYTDILHSLTSTWFEYYLDPPKDLDEVINELGMDSESYTYNMINILELVNNLNKDYSPDNIISTISTMYKLSKKQEEGLRSIIEYESNRRSYDELRYY